jgi:hypothetical protein
MSRRNAKLAIIHDLQCKQGDLILTKRDLVIIINALRNIDTTNFTERDLREYYSLIRCLSHLTYTK